MEKEARLTRVYRKTIRVGHIEPLSIRLEMGIRWHQVIGRVGDEIPSMRWSSPTVSSIQGHRVMLDRNQQLWTHMEDLHVQANIPTIVSMEDADSFKYSFRWLTQRQMSLSCLIILAQLHSNTMVDQETISEYPQSASHSTAMPLCHKRTKVVQSAAYFGHPEDDHYKEGTSSSVKLAQKWEQIQEPHKTQQPRAGRLLHKEWTPLSEAKGNHDRETDAAWTSW